ncbi:MAG: hypothetical protein QXL86_02840 [Candidatus Aenigmatarchaeota archaeon]
MKKGQSEVVENFFTILFGVIILAAISIAAYNLYTNQLKSEIENNLRQIGSGISTNIIKLYEIGKNSKSYPNRNESIKIAEVDLKLPSQVSGRNYEVVLISANPIWIQISNITVGGTEPAASIISPSGVKIVLRTTQSPIVEVEQEVPNVDVSVQGKSENGLNSSLSYYRYNFDGEIKDSIVLGDQKIIIDIKKVS